MGQNGETCSCRLRGNAFYEGAENFIGMTDQSLFPMVCLVVDPMLTKVVTSYWATEFLHNITHGKI